MTDLVTAIQIHFARPKADAPQPTSRVPAEDGATTEGRVTKLDPTLIGTSFAITRDAYDQIEKTIGQHHAETGAMLGGSRAHGLITRVYLDQSAEVSQVTYSPDVSVINRVMRKWDEEGIDFMGFVHSHPGGFGRPSTGDRIYAERILRALTKLDRMAMPIVQTVPDTDRFALNSFMAVRNDVPAKTDWRGHLIEDGRTVTVIPAPVTIIDPKNWYEKPKPSPFLERVKDAYDPAVMASTRFVAVGTGGSVGYLETMARAGAGQFVLIDPDVIEPKNVGTQAVDPLDIGRPKVEALANRLSRLNPNCHVWTIQAKDTEIDDIAFHRLLREPLQDGPVVVPATTLLCAFTDNFQAQDRIQRLGLQFGVPVLAASVYQEGRGIEIGFTAPGVTQACLRCAQSSRYKAYIKDRYVNTVTSDGTPFMATDRLNALKQIPTLGLLHTLNPTADAAHPATKRWRRALEAISDRNLALTRLDPDSSIPSFGPLALVTDGRCVMDETVWTKPTPDGADAPDGACPDCGGTGDLTDCIGTFADTRILPKTYGQNRRGSLAITPTTAVPVAV